MQSDSLSAVPIHVTSQTQLMLQSTLSISCSLSSARHSSNYAKLEEELTLTQQDNQELKNKCERLEHWVDSLEVHLSLVWNIIKQLQTQVQGKESQKGNHAKRANIEARVLTSGEGHLELEQLHEQVCLKEQQQAKDTARKAAGDWEWCKWQADITVVFTGPLNKSRWKNELEDIAAALALPESCKKDELLLGIFFFLENVYSGAAHSTRPVMAHRHICNVIIGAHPWMSNLLRSINVAPSQRGRCKHKRHVGIKRVHE